MKIELEMYGATYIAEMQNDDVTGDDLIELFSRLMVTAGYPPSVILLPGDDEGRYEYIAEDEEIVKRKEN